MGLFLAEPPGSHKVCFSLIALFLAEPPKLGMVCFTFMGLFLAEKRGKHKVCHLSMHFCFEAAGLTESTWHRQAP